LTKFDPKKKAEKININDVEIQIQLNPGLLKSKRKQLAKLFLCKKSGRKTTKITV
jgi:hypothetical protein